MCYVLTSLKSGCIENRPPSVAKVTQNTLLSTTNIRYRSKRVERIIYTMSKIPKDLEWNQTDDNVFVIIPKLKSLENSHIDTVITDSYIKVNFQRSVFYEFFLEHDIVSEKSVCRLLENCIKIKLVKRDSLPWERLCSSSNFSENREKLSLKTAVLEHNEKVAREREEEEKNEKKASKKILREQEMERLRELRSQTEHISNEMKTEELRKVRQWLRIELRS